MWSSGGVHRREVRIELPCFKCVMSLIVSVTRSSYVHWAGQCRRSTIRHRINQSPWALRLLFTWSRWAWFGVKNLHLFVSVSSHQRPVSVAIIPSHGNYPRHTPHPAVCHLVNQLESERPPSSHTRGDEHEHAHGSILHSSLLSHDVCCHVQCNLKH